jgi:hypothetical protein
MTNLNLACSQRAIQQEISQIRFDIYQLGKNLKLFTKLNSMRAYALFGELLRVKIEEDVTVTGLLAFLNTTRRIRGVRFVTRESLTTHSSVTDAVEAVLGSEAQAGSYETISTFPVLNCLVATAQFNFSFVREKNFEKNYVLNLSAELVEMFARRKSMVQTHNALILKHSQLMCQLDEW